jgi:Asp-tRNA(Asn)/Glu-tRNA(Gln) amidotransferase A subunit family amidase
VELDPDVADGFEAALGACRELGIELVEVPPPAVELELGLVFLDLVCAEMLVYHRRFDDRRELYRPSIRGFLEYAERGALSADDYIGGQSRRTEATFRWLDWFAEHRIDALLEPTVPIVARPRGHGYDEPFTDAAEISFTHYWNWTGFPVAALPSGLGRRSGLPVGVSLIGPAGSDWDVLAGGIALQARLGVAAAPF